MSTEPEQFPVAVMPVHVAAVVPLQHHEEFYKRTTPEDQLRVGLLLRIFDEIKTASDGVVSACRRLAIEHQDQSGFSSHNLKTLYYAFKSTRDWRVLVHKHKGPVAISTEFVEWFRMRVEQNSRGARQVMQEVRAEWAAGKSIPGYGTWSEYYQTEFPERDCPERYPLGFFPRGWSDSNLYTKQSSNACRALKRRGTAAAKRYLPHVVRDVSHLRPLELIVIDDFKTDILVQARNPSSGAYEIVPCNGLLAMDVATRRRLAWALKPEFSRTAKEQAEAGSKSHNITRADVQGLLYGVFTGHGQPTDYGCTILCENAAAAISEDFALALETLLGIQVARTGLMAGGVKTLRNGFTQGGGKPWEKGWVESGFNLMANLAGALPGQKGASYQLKPADLEAKVLYAEKLLNTDGLTPEQIDQLQVPFFKFEEAMAAYDRIFEVMERRTNHHMQGFEEIVEYRLPDGSQIVPYEALKGVARDEIVRYQPVPRMESPVERWERLIKDVRRVKPAEYALACLLLTPKKAVLRNHAVSFAHLSKGFTFADADSPVMALPEGTELLGYFDASKSDTLYCTDLKGRYLGSLKRRKAVDIRDAAAIGIEAGEITRLITKHVLNPVRERHAAEDAQLESAKDHNREKLREFGVPEHLLPPGSVMVPSPTGTESGITPKAPHAITLARPAAKPAKPKTEGLSAKLAKRAAQFTPEVMAAHRAALAAGIAAVGQAQDQAATLSRGLQAAGNASAELLEDGPVASPAPAVKAPSLPTDDTDELL